MKDPREQAREIVPCTCGLDEFQRSAGTDPRMAHPRSCPANYREAIAAALDEAT